MKGGSVIKCEVKTQTQTKQKQAQPRSFAKQSEETDEETCGYVTDGATTTAAEPTK